MNTSTLTTLCESVIAASEHTTPGPWKAIRRPVAMVYAHPKGYVGEACFVEPLGLQVYGPDWKHDGEMDAQGNEYICANARLIALSRTAAPALARAVQLMVPMLAQLRSMHDNHACERPDGPCYTCGKLAEFDAAFSGVLDDEGGA